MIYTFNIDCASEKKIDRGETVENGMKWARSFHIELFEWQPSYKRYQS